VSEPRFIDRVRELEELRKLAERGSVLPIYLFGPEGCGKTRLLKEFVKGFRGVAVYIDALERDAAERALLTNPVISELSEVVKGLVEGVPWVGPYLATRLSTLIEKIATRVSVSGRPLAIAVDDVAETMGLDQVEWYVKWLYELIKKLYELYSPRSVLVIASTSEGLSLEHVLRHTYASVRLLWNLDPQAFAELVKELSPPPSLDIDELWRATGGNPRALLEIARVYEWSIDAWMSYLERRLLRVVTVARSRGLEGELATLIDDPDAVCDRPSQRMEELYRVLVSENLFMYRYVAVLSGNDPSPDPELGIGRYYAWQMPAYRTVLSKLLRCSRG